MKGFLQRILQKIMKKNITWNIRRLDDDSFVPSSKRPSVLYCKLTDFWNQCTFPYSYVHLHFWATKLHNAWEFSGYINHCRQYTLVVGITNQALECTGDPRLMWISANFITAVFQKAFQSYLAYEIFGNSKILNSRVRILCQIRNSNLKRIQMLMYL